MSYDDDLEVDIAFGRWLKERRQRQGFSVSQASGQTGIPSHRIEDLENGLAERGITQKEAESFSRAYCLDVRAILQRAING